MVQLANERMIWVGGCRGGRGGRISRLASRFGGPALQGYKSDCQCLQAAGSGGATPRRAAEGARLLLGLVAGQSVGKGARGWTGISMETVMAAMLASVSSTSSQ